MNKTILQNFRWFVSNANLSKIFSGETVNTACYLFNMSPSISLEQKEDHKSCSGNAEIYDNLRVFGCPACFHLNERKLELKAKKSMFIGYPGGVNGYKILSFVGLTSSLKSHVTWLNSAFQRKHGDKQGTKHRSDSKWNHKVKKITQKRFHVSANPSREFSSSNGKNVWEWNSLGRCKAKNVVCPAYFTNSKNKCHECSKCTNIAHKCIILYVSSSYRKSFGHDIVIHSNRFSKALSHFKQLRCKTS